MFRNKLLVRNFATCHQIQTKPRASSSVFASVIASFSRGTFNLTELLPDTRTDINGFKKFKVPVFGSGGKCFSKFTDTKCWNCEKYLEVKDFACSACGALQHPKQKMSHFELFGISQTFDIDIDELSKKFKKLQTTFHPDKFAGKTKEEKNISEKYSRLVNKAYSTLKDPLLRGSYLLKLLKYPDCNAPPDQEFLKTMMSKNEELDCLTNENAIETFRNGLCIETLTYWTEVQQAFKSGNLDEAKLNLSKLNYYESINKRAKEKINKLQEKESC